jgi:hypothetical protein
MADEQKALFKNDPALNRKMKEPFPSQEAYAEAANAFIDGVRDLRQKHKIPNVLVVMTATAIIDGEEVTYIPTAFMGDPVSKEGMAAYVYGEAQTEREAMVGKYMRGGRKRVE